MVKQRLDFESIAQTADFAAPLTKGGDWSGNAVGNLTRAEAIDLAHRGDDSFAREAEKLLEQMTLPESMGRVWDRSPSGAYVVVPEFLAGMPDPMRRKRKAPVANKPVRIWVDTSLSAGISRETFTKRGVAIMALIMRLHSTRPIDVMAYSLAKHYDGAHYLVTTRIESSPLDLALAGFVLAHPAYERHLIHSIFKTHFGQSLFQLCPVPTARPDLIGAADGDIVIAGSHSGDQGMISDPLAWVNRMVNEANGTSAS